MIWEHNCVLILAGVLLKYYGGFFFQDVYEYLFTFPILTIVRSMYLL